MVLDMICETGVDLLLLLKIPPLLTLHSFGLVPAPPGQKPFWDLALCKHAAQSWGSQVLSLQGRGPWAVRGWAGERLKEPQTAGGAGMVMGDGAGLVKGSRSLRLQEELGW